MQVLCTCCSEKGRKEKWGMSFLFFPGNKEDGENSEQAWLFLVFTLTVPNLLSINKLAFLSPSSAWAIFCSYYPLTLCSLHPYLVLTFTALSLQITPCSFIFLHYRKKAAMQHTQDNRPNYQVRDCQTQLPSYLMPAYDCFWNHARGRRIQDPYIFVLQHQPLTVNPSLYESSRFLMERGPQFLRHKPTVSPLCQLRIKATFLFPPNFVYVFFIWLQWAEKDKIFGGITWGILHELP